MIGGGGARWAGLRRGHLVSRGTKGGVRHLNRSLWRPLPRGYLRGALPSHGHLPLPAARPAPPWESAFLTVCATWVPPRGAEPGWGVNCIDFSKQDGRGGKAPSPESEQASRRPGRGRGTGARGPTPSAGRTLPISPHSSSADLCPPPRSRLPEAGVHAAPRPKCPPPLSPRPSTRRRGVGGGGRCPHGPGEAASLGVPMARSSGAGAGQCSPGPGRPGPGRGGRACFRPGPLGAAGAEMRRAPAPAGQRCSPAPRLSACSAGWVGVFLAPPPRVSRFDFSLLPAWVVFCLRRAGLARRGPAVLPPGTLGVMEGRGRGPWLSQVPGLCLKAAHRIPWS